MTWEVLLAIAAVALLIGVLIARRSNAARGDASFTDPATREFHDHRDSYEKTRRELERQLLP